MPIRHLVLTPLPNGRTGNTLHLSVHLSPRLRVDGTLSDYADFADWGAFTTAAPALQFQVLINGAVRPGVTVAVTSPAVDPAVWRALFGRPPKAVPVRACAFQDRSAINLTSIDSAATSAAMLDVVGRFPGRAPASAIRAAATRLLGDLLPAAQHFIGTIGDGVAPTEVPTEFHDQLGALNGHPHLMRLLGLVYDLDVTVPAGGAPINQVSVRSNWPTKTGLTAHDEVPMRISVDATFKARIDDPAYRQTDWLALGGSKYAVSELDLINAIHQLGQLAADLDEASDPAALIEVPALLESGLSIICADLGGVLRDRLARQRVVEDGIDAWLRNTPNTPPPLLLGEDITLGYRCDVRDLAGAGVRSLHDRQVPAGYVFPRQPKLDIDPPADEGWTSIALSTDGSVNLTAGGRKVRYHQEGSPDIDKVEAIDTTAWRVDDHVISWGGWSLSAPRVGNTTTGDGAVKPQEPNTLPSPAGAQLIVDYAHVDGTLPKLRYGHTYGFRARCVDFAGHGPLTADAPPPLAESLPVQFGRLAPLVAPLPLRRASRPDPGVGDLPDVLVIKSELDQPIGTIAPTDRLLFPPRISQGRLERHDLPSGGNSITSYDDLAKADARSIADQTIVDPDTGELVAGAALDGSTVTPGPTKPPVGYLVDPVAGGVSFIGLPGGSAATPALMTYGAWGATLAVQLELTAGSGAPVVSTPDRKVSVKLPPGTVATAEVATAPDAGRLQHMAFGQGLDATATTTAVNGLDVALSPRRRITFVHAVRLPLQPPSLSAMTSSRTVAGQTDVVIGGTLGLHRATTEHVVLRSRWVDPIDDVTAPTPGEQVTKRLVTDLPVPLDATGNTESLSNVHLELGDTKRRTVTVTAESFCRFSRYFTERIDFLAGAAGATLVLNANGVTLPSVTLTRLDTGALLTRDSQFTVDRVAGTLRILDQAAIPAGTPCRVEFIPLPVSRRSVEAPKARRTFTFDVPASAAPVIPSVVAVLPAFARKVTATASRITVTHDGRVVRLHLARPWFSSGDGELLGVALDPVGTAAPTLTRWARDPLTDGSGPAVLPAVGNFPDAVSSANAVDGGADIAGHAVAYDAARQLWIADVLVDAEFGYRPFVQLHVCRFQPLAVDGQHRSGIVQLDALRLGADRKVVVNKLPNGRVRVTLTGPDDGNVVTVVTQTPGTGITDPDLRWRDAARTTLTRSGTNLAATHTNVVTLPAGTERRLVVEDAEQVTVETGGALTPSTVIAYREVVTLPADW